MSGKKAKQQKREHKAACEPGAVVVLPRRKRLLAQSGLEMDAMGARLVFMMNDESCAEVPDGMCPVIGAFVAFLVDGVPSAADALDATALAGTDLGPEIARRRNYACADFGVRRVAPAVLRAGKMSKLAKIAAGLRPITDSASADEAMAVWQEEIAPELGKVTQRRDQRAWERLGYVPGENPTYAAGRSAQAVFLELGTAGWIKGGAAAVVGAAIHDGMLAGATGLEAEAIALVAGLCSISTDEPYFPSRARRDGSDGVLEGRYWPSADGEIFDADSLAHCHAGLIRRVLVRDCGNAWTALAVEEYMCANTERFAEEMAGAVTALSEYCLPLAGTVDRYVADLACLLAQIDHHLAAGAGLLEDVLPAGQPARLYPGGLSNGMLHNVRLNRDVAGASAVLRRDIVSGATYDGVVSGATYQVPPLVEARDPKTGHWFPCLIGGMADDNAGVDVLAMDVEQRMPAQRVVPLTDVRAVSNAWAATVITEYMVDDLDIMAAMERKDADRESHARDRRAMATAAWLTYCATLMWLLPEGAPSAWTAAAAS